MLNLPEEFEWASSIELGSPEVYSLSQYAWPRFLLEESDCPDPILKFQMSAHEFRERFKIFGIRERQSQKLIAFLQAVHVEVDVTQKHLPDLGWRFSIQNAAKSSRKNCLSLVEASVDAAFRGIGLSKFLIERAKDEARAQRFSLMIAPVRPTEKVKFPFESIEDYVARRRSDGAVFDSWLRTHIAAGGTVANICHESVFVTATLPRWRDWTGLALSQSGPQLIAGALTPLVVDLPSNLATYSEPNVWVTYNLSPTALG